MREIPYPVYLDKVYGGWLGKCIGGTVGAVSEGVKELMDFSLETAFPEKIPPNDDLDLQILWLHVLEKAGPELTGVDLLRAFIDCCPYKANEYSVAKRNLLLGIRPPVSGLHNNQFWDTGMGCPIRSEIWAYVNPGNPALVPIQA